MSGPVMIVRIYYMLFEGESGWKLALWFSVILNVNLAILNMLPIPVLDGGHIVLAIIESVRRKPVNMRILEWVQTACATLIIGYMLYISFFDIGDLFGRNADRKSPVKQAPAKAQTSPAP
jgi:regulator of sigma E protease